MSGSNEAAKGANEGEAKNSAREMIPAGRSRRPHESELKRLAGPVETLEPLSSQPKAESARKAEPSKPAAAVSRKSVRRARDLRFAAVAIGALAVGTGIGVFAAQRAGPDEALTQIHAGLEAGRVEASRLNGEIERLTKSLATVRESSEALRSENKSRGSNLSDRLAKFEQGFEKKLAALGDKIELSERERKAQAASSAAPKPVALAAPVSPPPPASTKAESESKPEPAQTGSISDPKPKSEPKMDPRSEKIEGWAVREVYDGIALLEDRKRRLIEIAPGESIPGVGRVEAIERRGRSWVVVTKQGTISPQPW